jgi:hypothetical protein
LESRKGLDFWFDSGFQARISGWKIAFWIVLASDEGTWLYSPLHLVRTIVVHDMWKRCLVSFSAMLFNLRPLETLGPSVPIF